jgi:hypothetical protein
MIVEITTRPATNGDTRDRKVTRRAPSSSVPCARLTGVTRSPSAC